VSRTYWRGHLQAISYLRKGHILPRQGGGGHVGLDTDGHGNRTAPDAAQLFSHSNTEAVIQAQASVLCGAAKKASNRK